MKKIILLITFIIVSIISGYSQGVPQGMNYQAVARDKNGDVMADKKISLKINLYSSKEEKVVHFTETHSVVTSKLGLFSLVIGQGEPIYGLFDAIPWSTDEIWIEVLVQNEGENAYTPIVSSKLYTVPYAFVAGSVVGQSTEGNELKYKITYCPCNDGLKKLSVLYTGASGVTIKVYRNSNLTELVNTFAGVNTGDILLFDASAYSDQKFKDVTYVQTIGGATTVTKVNTKCSDYDEDLNNPVAGETFGNFSILSHTDKANATCTACDMKPDWKVGGNALFDACNLLGTKSNTDLNLITNNIERMRILKSGNVNITNSLDVNVDLTGRRNILLNTIPGSTTGIAGITSLTNTANATSPSTGALRVSGGAGILLDLHVGGSIFNGSALSVGGIISTSDATESTAPTNGALIVAGGAGIGKRLNVQGAGKFYTTFEAVGASILGSTLTVAGVTTINNNFKVKNNSADYVAIVENTNTSTGDGLLIKLGKIATKNNATAIASDAALSAINQTLLNPTVITNITNLLDNNSGNDPNITEFILATIPSGSEAVQFAQTTAATLCYAGIEITNTAVGYLNTYLVDNTNTGLNLPLNITAPINSALSLPYDLTAPINSGLGLPINLTASINSGLNLPVSFSILTALNSAIDILVPDGDLPGPSITLVPALPPLSIPAIPPVIFPAIPNLTLPAIPHIPTINTNTCDILGEPYNFASLTLNDVWAANPLNHDNTFITFADNSAGNYALGAVTAQSVTDWLAGYLTPKNVYHVLNVFSGLDPKKIWAEMKEQAIVFKDDYLKIGVQYSSGSGDYAEWLERANANENITAGDIVCVKGGKITKDLSGAEQVMAVSFRPIVLGNIPTPGKEAMGNNVAFMGQIPVKVMGPVVSGDYIVGKMATPGYGVAINPDNMTTEDFKNAVGRSWDTDNSNGAKMVNTVVGVHNGDFVKIVQKLEAKIANSDKRMESIEAKLEQITKTIPNSHSFSRK